MKFSALLTAVIVLLAAFALSLPESADAARFGGGRSFGSKPSMSQRAPAPSINKPSTAQKQLPGATAQRPGLFGGMGGILGGLLAGTLIGSLLSGHGFSGGGFMDIILIGLLIFLGLKLFAAFRNKQAPAAAGAHGASMGDQMGRQSYADANNNQSIYQNAASGWDSLRTDGGTQNLADTGVQVPAGFDVDEFLRGAKLAYNRLQSSWDKRDINDIAQFTSPAVQEAIRQQLAEDPTPSTTELLLVNANLLEVVNDGNDQRAQVYFDVLMRERPDQSTPTAVREIWHFVQPRTGGSWVLDGIQQVD